MAKAIGSLTIPPGNIQDADIAEGANIGAQKMEHQHNVPYSQADGAAVVSETKAVWVATATGTIESFVVRPQTVPISGDLQYTVDVQKAAAASGTYTTILSSVVTISSADTDETEENGTLSTTSYSDGDCFQVVVTTSGSTGTQGQGVIAMLKLREQP